jgi:hypothetical protein
MSFLAIASIDRQSCLTFTVSVICCVIIFFLMCNLLEDERTKDTARPSTFFTLSEMVSSTWYNWMRWFFGGTLALLYAGTSLFAPKLMSGAEDFIVPLAGLPPNVGKTLEALAGSVPPWGTPLFVLVFSILLFAPYLRRLLVAWRDVVLGVAGFYRLIDHTALETAEQLLSAQANDYDRAHSLLVKNFRDVPIPEEFIGQHDQYRLAYQLIWLNRKRINENGVVDGFNSFRRMLALPTDAVPGVKISFSHLFASVLSFCVLMGLFIILIPDLSGLAKTLKWAWPDPRTDGWPSLLESTIRNTSTYVIPTLLGLSMLPVRRRSSISGKSENPESALMSFIVIASFQWATAFVIHEGFTTLEVIWERGVNEPASMLDPYRQIWNFLYSLIPCVTLGIYNIGERHNLNKIFTAISVAFVVGIMFSGCDIVAELAKDKPEFHTNYYVFQMVFGFFVSSCLFVVMLASEQPSPRNDMVFVK